MIKVIDVSGKTCYVDPLSQQESINRILKMVDEAEGFLLFNITPKSITIKIKMNEGI